MTTLTITKNYAQVKSHADESLICGIETNLGSMWWRAEDESFEEASEKKTPVRYENITNPDYLPGFCRDEDVFFVA